MLKTFTEFQLIARMLFVIFTSQMKVVSRIFKLVLLFSLFYTDEFPIIIRNSSFVISTILLKLSFGAESGISQLFIVAGVGFGVGISAITRWYTRRQSGTVV